MDALCSKARYGVTVAIRPPMRNPRVSASHPPRSIR